MIIDTFMDQNATNEHVMSLRTMLLQTKPEDKIIFYFCGHGIKKEGYYFGTHNVDFENPAEGGLSIEAVYSLLDSIPARNKLVMLDACNSGQDYTENWGTNDTAIGVDGQQLATNIRAYRPRGARPIGASKASRGVSVSDVMEDVFPDYDNSYGINVIAATKGADVAYETNELKNGVFTYVLIQGLNTNLDGNATRGQISIKQLKQYVCDKVPKLTNGLQRPVGRNENADIDWGF
jgi:uncharacterized caspase-like protein